MPLRTQKDELRELNQTLIPKAVLEMPPLIPNGRGRLTSLPWISLRTPRPLRLGSFLPQRNAAKNAEH
jgi:hypothetical protein